MPDLNEHPKLFPVMLDLRGKQVLVVGAGRIAVRKANALLDAGAMVTMIGTRLSAAAERLAVDRGANVSCGV